MRVPVCIQNRHIHLSQVDAERLFGKGYVFSIEKKLTQPWEYKAVERVSIKWKDGVLENVEIIMPFRKFTQVEITDSDNQILWIHAKVTKSGELKEAEECSIIWPKWSVYLQHGVIVSERHIHMSVADAKDLWFRNNQIVKCYIPWNNWMVIDNVRIRSNDKFVFDIHLNMDDAKNFWLKTSDWVELSK